jgi:hypothetical protein
MFGVTVRTMVVDDRAEYANKPAREQQKWINSDVGSRRDGVRRGS